MKWIHSLTYRAKSAFLLALLILFVSAKNIYDNSNVSQLGSSFSSVYEDRLLVESYIYDLTDQLYLKKLNREDCASRMVQPPRLSQNQNMISTLNSYENTQITTEERVHFNRLKINLDKIMYMESLEDENHHDFETVYQAAMSNLHMLSSIQLMEARILHDNSKRLMAGFTLYSQFELAILIIIGLMIQALILTSKSILPRQPQRHELN